MANFDDKEVKGFRKSIYLATYVIGSFYVPSLIWAWMAEVNDHVQWLDKQRNLGAHLLFQFPIYCYEFRSVYLIPLSSCPCVDNPNYIEWYTYTYAMRWKSFSYLSIMFCQLYRALTFSDHLMDLRSAFLHMNISVTRNLQLNFLLPRLRWLREQYAIPIHQVLGPRLTWKNIMYPFSLYYRRPTTYATD